ncbi:MAG: flippase [Geminicoccaceae bacterium]
MTGRTGMSSGLATNMVAVLVGRVFTIVIGFASIALLTRHLGQEGYGHYRTILTLAGIGAVLGDLGLQFIVLRRISDPAADSSLILGAGVMLRLVASTAIMAIVAIAVDLLPYEPVVWTGVLVAAPYYVLFQTCMLLQGVFQKHLRQDLQMLAETLGGLVMLGGIYLAARAEAGVIAMVMAMVAGGIVQLLVVWTLAARLEPFRPRLAPREWRGLLRDGLPIAGSRLALMAILRGDILMLSLLGSASAVGLYGVPSKIFEILAGIAALFGGMLMPMLVTSMARGDDSHTNRLVTDSFDTMLIFGAGTVIAFLGFGRDILALLAGPEFVDAYPALCLIGVAVAANACGQIFRHFLMAVDLQVRAMRVDIVLLAMAIPTYGLLIPWLSFIGAALATATIETGLAIGLARTAIATGRAGFAQSRAGWILVAAAGGWLSMQACTALGMHWFIALPTGGTAYLLLLALLRALPLALLRGRKMP